MLSSSSSAATTTKFADDDRNSGDNPFITFTRATPPPPPSNNCNTTTSTAAKSCRLLYRGSLSLPDSELMLEGISFISNASPSTLASSPIPITLESQRNRALKFIGAVDLSDPKLGGNLDHHNSVRMYVHPLAQLSVSFFEMLFCTKEPGSDGISEMAVRVGLGESHNSSDTDLFIYGRISQNPSKLKPVVELHLSRLVQLPPSPQKPAFASRRPPRPDDPTPRIPPAMLLQSRGSPGRRGFKRVRSESATLLSQRDAERKRAKGKIIVDKDKVVKGKGRVDAQGYRIPDDPEPDNEVVMDDPFLVSSEDRTDSSSQVERSNKELVNRVTRKVIQSHGIAKTHAEYKDILGWIYRGTLFTFRKKSKCKPLQTDEVSMIVERHAGMKQTPNANFQQQQCRSLGYPATDRQVILGNPGDTDLFTVTEPHGDPIEVWWRYTQPPLRNSHSL